ncbi:hypothetical protein HKD37_01G001035 [Glycine soja]
MDCEDGAKKELQGVVVGVRKSKGFPLGGSGTSLASMEFLSMPQVQEVVLSADMQCEKCQKRVTDIIAKMNETESVVINVLEKKVTLTFRLPSIGKVTTRKITHINNRNSLPKVAIIKRLFRSSRA